MSESNFDQNRLNGLLQMAAQKTGMSPEQLQAAAQNGSLADAVGEQASPELLQALNDPQAAQKLLASPQVQKLLRLLNGG